MSDPKIVAALNALKLDQAVQGTLPELAVLRFTGDDADNFLQSQLTQDVKAVTMDQAALAGYCDAKGRLLASGVLLRLPAGGLAWIVRADLAEALQKRLRMFVLRAKVVIERLEAPVQGLIEPGGHAQAWRVTNSAQRLRIDAPSVDGVARAWVLDEASASEDGSVSEAFALLDCLTGLPWVSEATRERFIPQTLNLELIGGVSFSKGCYPGQEIVARSHYRGLVKRRASLGVIDQALPDAAGVDVFLPGQPQPVSRIIQSAISDGRTWVLWEAMKDTLSAPALQVGTPDGPTLRPLPPPYPLGLDGSAA